MTIKLYDRVTSLVDIPAAGVAARKPGVVIDIYPDGSFDVEFEPDSDQNLVVAAMTEDQVSLADERPRKAA